MTNIGFANVTAVFILLITLSALVEVAAFDPNYRLRRDKFMDMRHSNQSLDGSEDCLTLTAFTASEPGLASCYAVRRAVFIEEQRVPEEIEMDAYDDSATHILAVFDGIPCGAARLLLSDDGVGKIGRVCVLPSHRRRGIGRSIVLFAVEEMRRSPGCRTAKLGAQVHALEFYESMGFKLVPGEEYIAAGGVPHRDMEMVL